METYNAAEKELVGIGYMVGGTGGAIEIHNAAGKELVIIGYVAGHPNDGLINIYNHKGKWRSFTSD